MITYVKGNIFESPAKVIVNPVNTVGVMGKGLALQFKQRYPKMFKSYKEFCNAKFLKIGQPSLIQEKDHDILLFPTKIPWRNPSKIEYIEKGLKAFVEYYKDGLIKSVAFPMLGCGCGGLSWNEVKPLMEKYLSDLPIEVYIYEN